MKNLCMYKLTGSGKRSEQYIRKRPHPLVNEHGENDENITEDCHQDEHHLKRKEV